jgi:GrpB-like predicted nucleotidyltransferase (UPF0157 family)
MSEIVHFSGAAEVFARADALYEQVEWMLRTRLPNADVHHVGSTAVRGSITKGDLDVVVRVTRDAFHAAEDLLESVFERNTESSRSEDFAAFLDKTTNPELGVQLVVVGGAADTFLAWRRKLQTDEELREKYNELKRAYEGSRMDEYREAKAEFIARHLGSGSPGAHSGTHSKL